MSYKYQSLHMRRQTTMNNDEFVDLNARDLDVEEPVIQEKDLVARDLYEIDGRNIRIAVWDGTTFIGIRSKFGSRFLDAETPYERNGHFDTARPYLRIGRIPDSILLIPGNGAHNACRELFDYIDGIMEGKVTL